MELYSLVRFAHVALGVAALGSYWTAGFAKKGSPLHRAAGKVFMLAMCGIVLSGAGFAVQRFATGHPITGTFLAYLVVITITAMWLGWRAPKDKRDWPRYTGRTYKSLAVLNLLAGAASLYVGLRFSVNLFAMFSIVGFLFGFSMLQFARKAPTNPRWWMVEHGGAMIANGVATHIAFLSIGLPRLLPGLSGGTLQTIAWMGPLALAILANVWLKRRYRQTSPSVSQPSPVPRLNTLSDASTSPAGIASSFATRS